MDVDKRSDAFFEKAKAALARNASSFEYNKVTALNPDQTYMMNRMADLTHSFVTILDPRSLDFLHVTPNAQDIVGHPPEYWCNGGFRNHMLLIHPEEIEAVIQFHEVGMTLFRNAPPDERQDFRILMDMRLQGQDGHYRKFVRTSMPFSIDSEGNILAWLNSFQDITHLKSDTSVCFMVREGGALTRIFRYSLIEKEIQRVSPMTHREKEVLEGLAQGLDAVQIADRLSLTATTVNQHRRKLVEKTASNSTESMVTYLSMVGILGRHLQL